MAEQTMRVLGISRMFDNDRVALVSLSRKPTDDELRDLHERLRARPPGAPAPEPAMSTEARELAKRVGWEHSKGPEWRLAHIDDIARAIEHAVAERAAAQQQVTPEGWKLVPIDPTPDMDRAGEVAATMWYEAEATGTETGTPHDATYRAMVESAPSPTQEQTK